MAIFVNYDGPKLDKNQKKTVRSQAMVVVRGLQKKQAILKSDATTAKSNLRSLAPARDNKNDSCHTNPPEDDDAKHTAQQPVVAQRPPANSSRKRGKIIGTAVTRHQQQQQQPPKLNPWDLRGAPPQSTHTTGIDARTFQIYIGRCGSYTSYLDEGFVLVGFQQPSYFSPDLSKAACIYIGWLWTAGVLDSFRGAQGGIAYPYYEYQAVKELQRFIDGADARALHEVVYPVVVLGMFEMVRFNPRAITHMAAVERFIKARGGLDIMPTVMQHIVIMADMLECVCLDTTLAFNDLGPATVMHLMTSDGFLAGKQLLSCPLLLCNDEDFTLAAQYVDPAIYVRLVGVLQAASDSFQQFFDSDVQTGSPSSGSDGPAVDLILDDILANSATAANDVPGLFLETCALAARIMRRTLSGDLGGFDAPENELDVLLIYLNTRFLGLKAWTGLPYVYAWVNLVGFAASTDGQMRSYFIAEIVRCAFSYGCYQMEVFLTVLKNFLHLRNTIADRKMALLGLLPRRSWS